jgi:hypothetical protein
MRITVRRGRSNRRALARQIGHGGRRLPDAGSLGLATPSGGRATSGQVGETPLACTGSPRLLDASTSGS